MINRLVSSPALLDAPSRAAQQAVADYLIREPIVGEADDAEWRADWELALVNWNHLVTSST